MLDHSTLRILLSFFFFLSDLYLPKNYLIYFWVNIYLRSFLNFYKVSNLIREKFRINKRKNLKYLLNSHYTSYFLFIYSLFFIIPYHFLLFIPYHLLSFITPSYLFIFFIFTIHYSFIILFFISNSYYYQSWKNKKLYYYQ